MSNLPWERSSLEFLPPSFFFPFLPLSTLYLPAHASFEAFIMLDFLLTFILLDFRLAFLQTYCYSIVGRFPTTGSDWCASFRSWLWIHRYLEVFSSNVFHLRSTNFRRLFTTRSIPSDSRLLSLQPTVSRFVTRQSCAGACSPRARSGCRACCFSL